MNCHQAKDMMFAYIQGELDPIQAEDLRLHLESCDACKRELEDAQSVLSALQAADDSKVVNLVKGLIQQAIVQKASDIHFEPIRDCLRVRLRVDGVLREAATIEKELAPAVITRIKVIADMNVGERRIPQDGRIPVIHQGREYDLRVNSIFTIHGESVVLRILDKSHRMLGLDKLGMYADQLETVRSLLHQPSGLLIAAGPTGCGKTTALYSMLSEVQNTEIKLLTIEDPVECEFDGVMQVAVNRRTGLTFATAMRAFLRQDPDIILVGEIRDLEMAELCIGAATTSHLILSALHAEEAAQGLIRLVDMGVEPYLVGASVVGVIAMRLARLICPDCRELDTSPDPNALRALGLPENLSDIAKEEPHGGKLYKGTGCGKCHNTGFRGRTGIFEVLTMDPELATLINKRSPLRDLRDHAVAKGMITLIADARRKVLDGVTSAAEAARVTDSLRAFMS